MKMRSCLALVLTLALFLFTPGTLLAKDIVVLAQFPLSGPHGSLDELGWGFTDVMNWFNEEAGGVGGRKVKWFMEDMRYSPTVEVANFHKYCSEYGPDELLMATGYITGALKPLIKKVNVEQKIPWVDGSFSSEVFGKTGGPGKYPYYYSLGATYGDQIKALLRWIKEDHRGKGAPRVAFVHSPTAYGRDGLPEGLAYAKQKGVEVVARIEYPYTATDATSECMKIRKAKAGYVIYHGYTGWQAATAIFLKTLRKIAPKVRFTGTHYLLARLPFMLCKEAYDGVVSAGCWPPFDAIPRSAASLDNSMVKRVHDFAKKYRSEAYGKKGGIRDMSSYFVGAVYGFVIQKALLEAEKAGDVSREGINRALSRLVWDFHGMFDGKTFSYASHTVPMVRLYEAHVKIVKVGGKEVPTGKWTPVSEWINTEETAW
ncbi:MAG: ABC transporter substrate-binding protein [Deltaproteobacteria bacterium]|nr:ABC transporter substrate-binding protein [Deltaproteobacteria bacterium]